MLYTINFNCFVSIFDYMCWLNRKMFAGGSPVVILCLREHKKAGTSRRIYQSKFNQICDDLSSCERIFTDCSSERGTFVAAAMSSSRKEESDWAPRCQRSEHCGAPWDQAWFGDGWRVGCNRLPDCVRLFKCNGNFGSWQPGNGKFGHAGGHWQDSWPSEKQKNNFLLGAGSHGHCWEWGSRQTGQTSCQALHGDDNQVRLKLQMWTLNSNRKHQLRQRAWRGRQVSFKTSAISYFVHSCI